MSNRMTVQYSFCWSPWITTCSRQFGTIAFLWLISWSSLTIKRKLSPVLVVHIVTKTLYFQERQENSPSELTKRNRNSPSRNSNFHSLNCVSEEVNTNTWSWSIFLRHHTLVGGISLHVHWSISPFLPVLLSCDVTEIILYCDPGTTLRSIRQRRQLMKLPHCRLSSIGSGREGWSLEGEQGDKFKCAQGNELLPRRERASFSLEVFN